MADEKTQEKTTDLPSKLSKLMVEIESLSVLELSELVSALEDKFGVSAVAAAPVAAASGAAAGAADAGAAEEKSSFTVVLKGDGGKKMMVIKAIRELKPELTLMDAKKFVETAPKDVLVDVKKEEAEAAKKKLVDSGAEVELK